MGHKVMFVAIRLALQHLGIVNDGFAVGLVVVDYPYLIPMGLPEPDRRRIANAQVPCGIDRQPSVLRDISDTALALSLSYLPAEVPALDRGIEATFKLLGVLFRRHFLLSGL